MSSAASARCSNALRREIIAAMEPAIKAHAKNFLVRCWGCFFYVVDIH